MESEDWILESPSGIRGWWRGPWSRPGRGYATKEVARARAKQIAREEGIKLYWRRRQGKRIVRCTCPSCTRLWEG